MSWKRKCKNYELVKSLIGHSHLAKKKIIIIGEHQTVAYGANVTKYDYLENSKLMDLLKTVKIVVVPSKYDSNPNILIEAVQAGCNIVTSVNVGNHENLNKECIVANYNNNNCWVQTIERCLKRRYEFIGPKSDKVMKQLKTLLLTRFTKNKKAIGVYKIPAEIEQILNGSIDFIHENFSYAESYDESFIKNIVNYDIYFNLFIEIAHCEESNDINYIIYDPSIENNTFSYVYKVYPSYNNIIKIWKIKDMPSLMSFNNGSLYFMRGNYQKFYKIFIPASAKSILYPATATIQDASNRLVPMDPYKFSIVLVHEDPIYRTIYQYSKCVLFNKFASDKYICYNLQRDYDICFIATEKQSTKNHPLFLEFVKYLNDTSQKYNIIFVGNLPEILDQYQMDDYIPKLINVKLTNYISCTKEKLISIYNRSKINIILSGRDAAPRVVYESAACGCFNIALDTLSDGKNFYDGYLGILVGDPNLPKILKKSLSLSYEPSVQLWEKIMPYLKLTYDHTNISIYFKTKYNLQNVINDIYK